MSYYNFVDRSRAHVVGGYRANAAAEIQTGILVRIAAAKTLTQCTAALHPDGIAEGLRQLVYAPTVLTLDAGEYCNVVSGSVLVRASADFFTGSTLPTFGATIYSAASGLMDVTGTHMIGKCIKTDESYRTPPNSNTDTVLLSLELGGLETVVANPGGG
jgi:hypothetical protein